MFRRPQILIEANVLKRSGFLIFLGTMILIFLTPNLLIASIDEARIRFLERSIDQNTSRIYIINYDENVLRDPSEVLKLSRLSDIKGLQPAACNETSNQSGAVLCILAVKNPCGREAAKLAIATSDSQIAVIEQFKFRSSGLNLATNVTGFGVLTSCSMESPK